MKSALVLLVVCLFTTYVAITEQQQQQPIPFFYPGYFYYQAQVPLVPPNAAIVNILSPENEGPLLPSSFRPGYPVLQSSINQVVNNFLLITLYTN